MNRMAVMCVIMRIGNLALLAILETSHCRIRTVERHGNVTHPVNTRALA